MREVMILRKLALLLMVFLLSAFFMTSAFASDIRTGTPSESSQAAYNAVQTTVNDLTSDITSDVTTDDIVNKLENKGNDIVRILQTVGKFVCIGVFIVCCFLTIIGMVGNKRLMAGAIMGLIFSGIAYAGIVCGRDLVNWVAFWAAS